MRASKASWRVSDYAEARLVKGSLRIPVRSTHLQTACARPSLWNPVRHSREEPVGEAGVIGDKQAESEADYSRRDSQGAGWSATGNVGASPVGVAAPPTLRELP